MSRVTSKIPSIENWSRNTTLRQAYNLFNLFRYKPEEFEILIQMTVREFRNSRQNLKKQISELKKENAKLLEQKLEILDQVIELQEKLEKYEDQ